LYGVQPQALAETVRYRSIVAVPLLHEGNPIGTIAVARAEPGLFPERQIALLQTFAEQAVIAIQNVGLFDQVRARTQELSESLQQQTATADVLKVISRSTFDLQTVLDTLTASATRLCAVDQGVIFLRDGDVLRLRASFGFPPEAVEYALAHPMLPNRGSATGRVALEGRPVHIHDVLADPEYSINDYQRRFGYRTVLCVPLLREGATIGVFALTHGIVEPFSDKQIELVSTFADQAVIAIENARLLNELRESLQQQTATADVLKVISRSTFELQPVFDSMAESAVRLCEAERAYIFRFNGNVLQAVASFNAGPENQDWVYRNPIPLGRHSVSARAGLERRTVQVADIQADSEYSYVARDVDPIRTTLAVPMLKGDELIGTITIYRLEVKPFTENQIALMETFADQAVIAIENARLFESLQTRTRELAQSLQDLQTTQDRLVQTQKLASLGQLTAGIAHEIKNPLNFINNFSSLSTELFDELQDVLKRVSLDATSQADIHELTSTLRANLVKIEEHGKRADSIVKNMLLHSREGLGEHRPVDINALVEESLNLAYHGARAEKQGFNITLERSFDLTAGDVDLFPQEITRVLLNLISNGFYAATQKASQMQCDGYEPVLAAATKSLGDSVEIKIRDNGTGIPPEVKDKMFNPFFTTKPPGEGTGLGLSLSHDIIVKQHAGSIEVDTEPGKFTEFRIILPRTAAAIAKSGGQA
jgi:GAF domain-containing protein